MMPRTLRFIINGRSGIVRSPLSVGATKPNVPCGARLAIASSITGPTVVVSKAKIDPVRQPVADLFVNRPAVRADHFVGAQLGRELQPVGMEIDRDHLPGAGYLRRHDRGKAEGTGAEDGKRLPGVHLEHVEHRARAGLNPATERAQDAQGRILANPDHAAPAGQGMGGEGGLIEEVAMHRAIVAVQVMGPVGTGTGEVVGVEAICRPGAAAARAVRAPGEGHHDVIARLQIGDARSHRLDHAGALVAQNHRPGRTALGAGRLQVRVADARRGQLDQDFVGARFRHL